MATLHPLIQRQPHPFPYHERLSEEILEDKGKRGTPFSVAGQYSARSIDCSMLSDSRWPISLNHLAAISSNEFCSQDKFPPLETFF